MYIYIYIICNLSLSATAFICQKKVFFFLFMRLIDHFSYASLRKTAFSIILVAGIFVLQFSVERERQCRLVECILQIGVPIFRNIFHSLLFSPFYSSRCRAVWCARMHSKQKSLYGTYIFTVMGYSNS